MKKRLLFFITLAIIPTTSFCMEKKDKNKESAKKEISFEKFTLKAHDAYKLGLYHYYDLKEYEQAFKYIKTAAENNHREAQALLAFMYFEGKGCEKDLGLAMKYCSLAVKRGNRNAQALWFDIVTEAIKEMGSDGGKNPLQLVLDPSMLGGAEGNEEDTPKTKKDKKEKDEAWKSMYV